MLGMGGIAVRDQVVRVGVFTSHQHTPKRTAKRVIAASVEKNLTFGRKAIEVWCQDWIRIHESESLATVLVSEEKD
jgi:hypothetical protein